MLPFRWTQVVRVYCNCPKECLVDVFHGALDDFLVNWKKVRKAKKPEWDWWKGRAESSIVMINRTLCVRACLPAACVHLTYLRNWHANGCVVGRGRPIQCRIKCGGIHKYAFNEWSVRCHLLLEVGGWEMKRQCWPIPNQANKSKWANRYERRPMEGVRDGGSVYSIFQIIVYFNVGFSRRFPTLIDCCTLSVARWATRPGDNAN